MKFLRLSFAVAASLIVATAAFASDAPRASARQTASVPLSWTGWYLGGYVGGQQGKSNTSADSFTDSQSYVIPGQTNPVTSCYTWEDQTKCYDSSHKSVTTQPYTLNTSQTYPGAASNGNLIGVTFGGLFGYNQQVGSNTVAGFEVDGGYSGARNQTNIYAYNSEQKMPWNVNVTGRVMLLPTTAKDFGVYVKAGLAIQNQQSTLTGPTGTASEDKTKAGYTVGGGIEQMIPAWRGRARVEGMYSKVSDQVLGVPGATSTLSGGSWNVKAGLLWSLNN